MDNKGSRVRKNGVWGSASLVRSIGLAALGVQSVSAGFIDMDTPLDKRTTTSLVDGSVYHLVSF